MSRSTKKQQQQNDLRTKQRLSSAWSTQSDHSLCLRSLQCRGVLLLWDMVGSAVLLLLLLLSLSLVGMTAIMWSRPLNPNCGCQLLLMACPLNFSSQNLARSRSNYTDSIVIELLSRCAENKVYINIRIGINLRFHTDVFFKHVRNSIVFVTHLWNSGTIRHTICNIFVPYWF